MNFDPETQYVGYFFNQFHYVCSHALGEEATVTT